MCGLRTDRGSFIDYCCFIVFALLLPTSGITADSENGYYMVSAAQNIFSNQHYGVVVGIFQSSISCSFEVTLKGPQFQRSMEMQMTPMHPMSSYRFQLPELESGDYTLIVNGVRGLNFTARKSLTWQYFKNFVKIQTPKTIYWAGDLLQFRVIFHDELMKAASPEYKATIWIEDAKSYRIRLYTDLQVVRGVFDEELHISRYPNTGLWYICVKNGINVREQCAEIQVKHFDRTLSALNATNIEANVFDLDMQLKQRPLSNEVSAPQTFENSSSPADTKPVTFRGRKKSKHPNEKLIPLNFGEPLEKPETLKFKLDQQLEFVIVTIMFNGLVLASSEAYPDKNKTFTIDVQLTSKMWPFVHVILYGMEPKTNILYVATESFKLPRGKHDHVEIIAPEVVKPGDLITLRVKAMAKSYMGIAAIDSRIVTMEDNDFNEHYFDKVMAELLTYPLPYRFSGKPNASNLGLFTLTNVANVSEIHPSNVTTSLSPIPAAILKIRDTPMPARRKRHRSRSRAADSRMNTKRTVDKVVKTRTYLDGYCCTLKQTRRNEFQDVMIFASVDDTLAGWRNFTTRIPAIITKWRISAFLVMPTMGLGLLGSKPFISIDSRKDLYLEYTLPHHIKVGELLKVPVKCFNRLDHVASVTLKIKQTPANFKQQTSDKKAMDSPDYVEQNLEVPSASVKVHFIYIRAIKGGKVRFEISAEFGALNDTLTRHIEFIQPGQLLNDEVIAYKVMGWHTLSTDFELKLPYKPTLDGITCHLSGSLIAANINDLQMIDRFDNGEQLISKLMETFLLWDFVKDQSWITSQWLQFLDDQLNDGYQAMQRMRTRSGGYSFHEQPHDNCTSVWLTSYALKMMQRLELTPLTFDVRAMVQSEKFLLNNRLNRTEFEENCDAPERRKLSNLELSLDVLKSLQTSNRMIRIQESHSWVSQQLTAEPNYQLEAKRGFNLQEWQPPNKTAVGDWAETRRNIEIASRILIVHLYRKKEANQQLYRWIIDQLYGENCRVVNYECTMARKAIYTYAHWQTGEAEQNLNITIVGDIDQKEQVRIDDGNKYQTQTVKMQAKSQTLSFNVYGLGELLVQCLYQYDAKQLAERTGNVTKSYVIEVSQLKLTRPSQSYLKICLQRDKKKKKFYIGSDVTVELPSGYMFSGRSVQRLFGLREVVHADTKEGYTKLLMRWTAQKANKLVCVTVLILLQFKVSDLQPGMIAVTDTNSVLRPQVRAFNLTF